MAQFDVIGSTGLRRYGKRGRPDDEFHPHLRGTRGVRIFREIRDNDSVTGAAFQVTQAMVRQVRWKAQEANASDEAKLQAEFLTQVMEDMDTTWPSTTGEILSFLTFGWALFNKVWKYRLGKNPDSFKTSRFHDGRVGIAAIDIRSQESLEDWLWDEHGRVIAMRQRAYPSLKLVDIPMEAAVLFRTEHAKGNPEGRSLLRSAYRTWFILKRLQELEAIGIERDLVGLPLMRLPFAYLDTSAPADKKAAYENFKTTLQQIRRNEHEGIIFPAKFDANGKETGFDIELLSTGGSRSIDLDAAIKRQQREMSMIFGTNFQFLGMDKVGSFSLSSDMTNMFGLSIGAILDNIQETFDREVIQELFELNGCLPENRPKWVHGDVEKQDMSKFADMLLKLTDAQLLTPDPELEDHIRDAMQLPLRTMDGTEHGDVNEMPRVDVVEDVPSGARDVSTGKNARHTPTLEMAAAARDALEARGRAAKDRRGMTVVTHAKAKAIAARTPLATADVQRMQSFFTHAAKTPRPLGSKAWQEWNGWGGDAGAAWCSNVLQKSAHLDERTAIMKDAVELDAVIKAGRGLMVGLWLDAKTAKQLAVSGGEKPADMHITLAYLGDSSAVDKAQRAQLLNVVRAAADMTAPLQGKISGLGIFSGSGDDVLYASPDVVGLAELRTDLVEMLLSAGLPVKMEHGFDPHITLAYLDPGAPRPEVVVTNNPLRFTELVVADGGKRQRFPLSGKG